MEETPAYEAALKAVNALHADTSVSMRQTYNLLSDLRDEICVLLDAVQSDLDREEKEG